MDLEKKVKIVDVKFPVFKTNHGLMAALTMRGILQCELEKDMDAIEFLQARAFDKKRGQWKDKEAREAVHWLLQLLVWLLQVYLSEESHRGGFRNLLLDGWWLEFWEIILLAAGDVERNPGPRQITGESAMRRIQTFSFILTNCTSVL